MTSLQTIMSLSYFYLEELYYMMQLNNWFAFIWTINLVNLLYANFSFILDYLMKQK